MAMTIIRLVMCGLLLLFLGNPLRAAETPEEIIAELLDQESCGGCFEVAELFVEGGTPKTVLLFKRIHENVQEIRLQVINRGADNGYAYYSRIDAEVKDHIQEIMWVYRPQDKVRRYNSILHAFLDTGIPPYFVDRAGWWRFYKWAFNDGEKRGLHGIPLVGHSFLPEVIIAWEKEGGIFYVTALELITRGNIFFTATFSNLQRVDSKIRPGKIVIGPPNGPFTTITVRSMRLEKLDENWTSQIFHQERLPERRTPTDIQTRQGEILAKFDFLP